MELARNSFGRIPTVAHGGTLSLSRIMNVLVFDNVVFPGAPSQRCAHDVENIANRNTVFPRRAATTYTRKRNQFELPNKRVRVNAGDIVAAKTFRNDWWKSYLNPFRIVRKRIPYDTYESA